MALCAPALSTSELKQWQARSRRLWLSPGCLQATDSIAQAVRKHKLRPCHIAEAAYGSLDTLSCQWQAAT